MKDRELLLACRQWLQYTQEQMAGVLKVTLRQYQRYERGDPVPVKRWHRVVSCLVKQPRFTFKSNAPPPGEIIL